MGINPDDLNLIIEQAIQRVLQTDQNTTNFYKNMSKHKNCSKCSTLKTTEIYKKKDRSVCKSYYITNIINLMKKRFGLMEEISSSKQDISSKQGFSDTEDSSKKEDISNKQVRSRKQDSSKKNKLDLVKKIVQTNYMVLSKKTLILIV